ncbi:MAG TPA: DUF881 domain-containing protein [Mycobacteriales bacterium]|jgi:uncharacterized protein YlxW (UPF0749 family)|nr:DUF881 domain-containing protein [Mycobacteriales bacterium]
MSDPRPPRRRHPLRSQALIGLMLAVLGFALVVQLRAAQQTSKFASARQEDLVRILDDLTARSDRLRGEIEELQRTRDRLTGGAGQDAAALAESRRRQDALRILAGTVAAAGPGVEVTITDPEHAVTSDLLLDTMQELRDAGAEALQVNGVRLTASSWFSDSGPTVLADGTPLRAPYVFRAIGDAHTLADAMGIPGGVEDAVSGRSGATIRVEERARVVVDALRPLSAPRYARAAAGRE